MKRRCLLLIAIIAISMTCASCGGGGHSSLTNNGGSNTNSGSGDNGSGGDNGGSSGTGGNDGGGTTGGTDTSRIQAQVDSSSPTLDDGSHYATVTFVASGSGNATLTATSTLFDTMLVVEQQDADGSSEVVAEDDDSGGVTNSKVTFPVVSGMQYTALIGSPSGDPSGACTVAYPSDLLTPGSRAVSQAAPKK